MTLQQIELALAAVIESCRGLGVPTTSLDDMAELTKAGEPGVALENLCSELYEYDASVSTEVLGAIKDLAAAMGIDPTYWRPLEQAG